MSRFPYTYAADYLRETVGPKENELSLKLSRGDAALIQTTIAQALKYPKKN